MFQTTKQICVLLYPFAPILFAHHHLKVCEMSRKINAWLLVNLPWPLAELGTKIDAFVHIKEKNEIQRESSITNQLSISINHHSSFSAVTSLQQSNLDQSRRAPKRWCDRFIITRCVPKHGVQMFSGLPFALASLISRLPPGLRPPGPALWERRLQRRRHHPADPHRVPGQAATNHQRVPWTAQLAAGSGMVMMVMKWWLVKLLWIAFAAIYI